MLMFKSRRDGSGLDDIKILRAILLGKLLFQSIFGTAWVAIVAAAGSQCRYFVRDYFRAAFRLAHVGSFGFSQMSVLCPRS
jgi:hypothetical protein